MKPTRRPLIPLRRRILLGCEGDSELGYGALLRKLLDQRRQDVHLDVVLLRPGGGDPLTLVERTRDYIMQSEKKGEPSYEVRGLLLDSDLSGQARERDDQALKIASSVDLRLIWQDPCHEALLLRHLEGCAHLSPKTSGEAMDQLLRKWDTYEKGMSALRLGQRLSYEDVLRAAAVEQDFLGFLTEIGFITGKK